VPIDTGWRPTPATAGARIPCHSISTTAPQRHSHQPSDTEGGVTDVTTATKVSIKPLEDRVVVQANEAETTTASGLVIPDTAKEKPQEGTVIAVGPGRIDDNGNRVPLDVNVGDVVIYSKYGGTEVKYGGEEYLVLSARDLLAVVEK
jgi:chaperonin GroES